MGWCDDVMSRLYNRPIAAGSPDRHERLWREDEIYDILLTTSHNQRPRIRGAGSAIFMHLARPGYEATQGCVAISRDDMRRLLPRLSRKSAITIVS
jgi:L,D-peptidoglycan transpeptidase YkuD (ErfK/YbiS/YcfS/YnhG family)